MADVKIGNVSFSREALAGISLTMAYEAFPHIRKDIVKAAYETVNGKKSSKKARE
jgi:hypothetical protein